MQDDTQNPVVPPTDAPVDPSPAGPVFTPSDPGVVPDVPADAPVAPEAPAPFTPPEAPAASSVDAPAPDAAPAPAGDEQTPQL